MKNIVKNIFLIIISLFIIYFAFKDMEIYKLIISSFSFNHVIFLVVFILCLLLILLSTYRLNCALRKFWLVLGMCLAKVCIDQNKSINNLNYEI